MVVVSMGSEDVAFIFEENSSDFQQIAVQGQVTYRINDFKKIASLLNFLINPIHSFGHHVAYICPLRFELGSDNIKSNSCLAMV
ncbi:hypothetical protein S2091_2966 [Solimicrobium silvestre]|uniref:Uncharacterized protein n=1 Tax=Solimicrobium silvestre TaxID=2099400 RepID=A0A2S9GX60_9BURK|nr:hypothetical protein S2091_2966 [Solimicrobium silvestre]